MDSTNNPNGAFLFSIICFDASTLRVRVRLGGNIRHLLGSFHARSTCQTRRNGVLHLHETVLTFPHVEVCSTAITLLRVQEGPDCCQVTTQAAKTRASSPRNYSKLNQAGLCHSREAPQLGYSSNDQLKPQSAKLVYRVQHCFM